jgi:hypothetical protein
MDLTTTVHILGSEFTLDTSIALHKTIWSMNLDLETVDRMLFSKSQEAVREMNNLCTDLEAGTRGDWLIGDSSSQINQLLTKRAALRQSLSALLYVLAAK